MTSRLKSVLISTTCVALVIAAAACGGSNEQAQPVTTSTPGGQSTAPPAQQAAKRDNALVRAVHAIPAAASVDIFAGDTKAFAGLNYKAVTPYMELPGERTTFKVRPAGMDTADPLADNSEGLDDGEHYTVVASPGEDGKAAVLRVVADDLKRPDEGKARVRLIHAASDAGDIDVYVRGQRDALFDKLTFSGNADYTTIDPATTTIDIRQDGRDEAMVSLPNMTFDAGKSYTLVLTGRARSPGKLELIRIEDQIPGR